MGVGWRVGVCVCVMLATVRSKNLNMLRSTRSCLCESLVSAVWAIHPVCASAPQCLFHAGVTARSNCGEQRLSRKRMAGHPSSWLQRDCRDRIAQQSYPFIKKLFYLTPNFMPRKAIPLHKRNWGLTPHPEMITDSCHLADFICLTKQPLLAVNILSSDFHSP